MVLSELGTAQTALGLLGPAAGGPGGGGSAAAAAASAALVRHQHEVAAMADAMCTLAALCSCRRPGQVAAVTVEVGAGGFGAFVILIREKSDLSAVVTMEAGSHQSHAWGPSGEGHIW